MRAYRAILIPLPRECDVFYIRRLMALANLTYRDYAVVVPDLLRSIQHQLLFCWQQFRQSLVFGAVPKRWLARTWAPLKTYRIFPGGKRIGDKSAPVVLDLMHNVVKVRQACHNQPGYVVELPMLQWVLKRIAEGADIKYAAVGLKNGKPHLALVAEREVQPVQPGDYTLVVDVNSWRHGIAWALVKSGKVVKWTRERPNLGFIGRVYSEVLRLEREYGTLKRLGLHRTPEGRRLRRPV
jgi:putative transposase